MTRSQSGLAEVVENGVNGWSLDSDEDMIETLVGVLERPECLGDIRAHNMSASFPFSWEKVIDSTEEYYRRAMAAVS